MRAVEQKIKASILVIGFQKEDDRMYPHLYDFLRNLRSLYDDVIYIGDGDQGEGLYAIDRNIRDILDILNPRKLFGKFCALFRRLCPYRSKGKKLLEKASGANSRPDNSLTETTNLRGLYLALKYLLERLCWLFMNSFSYVRRQRRLIKKLKNVKFRHNKCLVLAIDHTSCLVAVKYFPGKVVLWSYDILTKDYPVRIKNGFLDRLVTSKEMSKVKALIIQDEQRKRLLEESVGAVFTNTIYLPVSLNDSEFCRKAAENRQKKNSLSTVSIVQSGWIGKGRWSDKLIDAYQNWPISYELTLRGFIQADINDSLLRAKRKPEVSGSICDTDLLPQILNNCDIGFVGYSENDSNHRYIENASSQMVEFLRLGIPVIGCGSSSFNDFVTRQNIGIGISSIEEMEEAINKIVEDYSFFSSNARKLYESRFDLCSYFNNYLIKSFESLFAI